MITTTIHSRIHYSSLLTFFLLLSVSFTISCSNNKGITLKVIEEKKGNWAYQIDIEGKKYIYQDIIPAVGGNKPFASKTDAKKTGELVAKKMRNGDLPTLSIEEIQTLNLESLK